MLTTFSLIALLTTAGKTDQYVLDRTLTREDCAYAMIEMQSLPMFEIADMVLVCELEPTPP